MGTDDTTLSGFARHPSTGGELPGADTIQPPRRASHATPPQEGNCRVQTRYNHPVRLRLPPLHRRGIATSTGGELLPPQEGNCYLHRRGIAGCRHDTTTPSGCARHPSRGGELPGADTIQPPRRAAPATPPEEGNCRVRSRCVDGYG